MSTQLTQAYLQHKAGGQMDKVKGAFSKGDVESAEQVPDDELVDEDESQGQGSGYFVYIVIGCLAAAGVHGAAMGLVGGSVVMFAGAVTLGLSVIVIGGEFQLSKMETFRQVHNKLRQDVNVFAGENEKLSKSNDELNLQVFCLKEQEERFRAMAEEQGSNVNDLVRLVKENQEIIDEKHKVIRNDIVESLINAAFEGERDEDGEFSDREIKRLLNKMRGLPAVTIDEDLLKAQLEKNRSVMSLIELIKDLDVEGEQIGDHIFKINDDDPELLKSLQK